jgi:hypothetical protein
MHRGLPPPRFNATSQRSLPRPSTTHLDRRGVLIVGEIFLKIGEQCA